LDRKIIIGSDHGGYELKKKLKNYLKESGHTVTDVGTNTAESVDYPEYATSVAQKVAHSDSLVGIVICTSGIGVSIVANKVKGIRAALCTSVDQARLSRQHNDANILALSARFTPFELVKEICDVWLNTEFDGGRHKRRVDQISEIECKN
jgi:ribose 5-phosphate isomerase B